MTKDTYLYMCHEANAGRDAFISHPDTNEEGRLTACVLTEDHMIVETAAGDTRHWDYHECEEMDRMKEKYHRR